MNKGVIKIIALVVALAAGLMSAAGCRQGEKPVYKYDFNEMAMPYWAGNTMYNESTLLLEGGDGSISANLAHVPDSVLSIRDFTLEKEFKQGVDYTVSGRTITRLEHQDNDMPYFTGANIRGEGISVNPAIKNCNEGEDPGDVLFTDTMEIFMRQIFVTYKFSDSEKASVPRQDYAGGRLLSLQNSLVTGEDLSILVLGDSISGGGQSSSGANLEPFCPNWVDIYGDAVSREIKKRTDTQPQVSVFNKSVGGMSSSHDIDMYYSPDGEHTWAEYYTKMYKPDIVMIAHGMNDGTWYVTPEKFIQNLETIMSQCQAVSQKQLDFIVVGCMRPNDSGAGWLGSPRPGGGFIPGYTGTPCFNLQQDYPQKMAALEDAHERLVYVEMWDKHTRLLEYKKYEDMTVNNLNHPNDFIIRVYAMSLIDVTLAERI